MGFLDRVEKWVSEDVLNEDDDDDGLNRNLFLFGFFAWCFVISICVGFCCYHCFLMTCVSRFQSYQLTRKVDRQQVRRAIRNSMKRQERGHVGRPSDSFTTMTSVAVKDARSHHHSESMLIEIISEITPSCAPDAGEDGLEEDGINSISWQTTSEEGEKAGYDSECQT